MTTTTNMHVPHAIVTAVCAVPTPLLQYPDQAIRRAVIDERERVVAIARDADAMLAKLGVRPDMTHAEASQFQIMRDQLGEIRKLVGATKEDSIRSTPDLVARLVQQVRKGHRAIKHLRARVHALYKKTETCDGCSQEFPPDELAQGEDCQLCRSCLAELQRDDPLQLQKMQGAILQGIDQLQKMRTTDAKAAQRPADGWEALEQLRDLIIERNETNKKNFATGRSPCKDQSVLLGCTVANDDTIRAIGAFLDDRPATITTGAGSRAADVAALPLFGKKAEPEPVADNVCGQGLSASGNDAGTQCKRCGYFMGPHICTKCGWVPPQPEPVADGALQLFTVQDDDGDLWVVAEDYQAALQAYRKRVRDENPEMEEDPVPDGISHVCRAGDLLLPTMRNAISVCGKPAGYISTGNDTLDIRCPKPAGHEGHCEAAVRFLSGRMVDLRQLNI